MCMCVWATTRRLLKWNNLFFSFTFCVCVKVNSLKRIFSILKGTKVAKKKWMLYFFLRVTHVSFHCLLFYFSVEKSRFWLRRRNIYSSLPPLATINQRKRERKEEMVDLFLSSSHLRDINSSLSLSLSMHSDDYYLNKSPEVTTRRRRRRRRRRRFTSSS